jgi:hypothetical protein
MKLFQNLRIWSFFMIISLIIPLALSDNGYEKFCDKNSYTYLTVRSEAEMCVDFINYQTINENMEISCNGLLYINSICDCDEYGCDGEITNNPYYHNENKLINFCCYHFIRDEENFAWSCIGKPFRHTPPNSEYYDEEKDEIYDEYYDDEIEYPNINDEEEKYCIDTDLGLNPYKFGFTSWNYWKNKAYIDTCINKSTLQEGYCINNKPTIINIQCKENCSKGICTENPPLNFKIEYAIKEIIIFFKNLGKEFLNSIDLGSFQNTIKRHGGGKK